MEDGPKVQAGLAGEGTGPGRGGRERISTPRYGTNAALKASTPAGLVWFTTTAPPPVLRPFSPPRLQRPPPLSSASTSFFQSPRRPFPPSFPANPLRSPRLPLLALHPAPCLVWFGTENGIPRRGAAAAQDQHRQRRPHGRRRVRRGREPAVAAVAQAAAGDQLLRAMQDARGRAQVRVQHVLPRLHQRRPLLPVPRLPPRPPRHPDKEVLLPRRDPRVGDPEGAGHHRRADLHHQQRARGVPQRAPAAQARQGRHQHLRGLRAQPPRHLPLLLPRMQDRWHFRRVPRPEEARRRQEDEAEAEEGGGVGLGRLVHHHQRRERQEQRGAELQPVHPAGHRQQLPLRQAAQGHPTPVALRQPHCGVLKQSTTPRAPSLAGTTVAYTSIHPYLPLEFFCSVLFYTTRRRRAKQKITKPPLAHLCASGRGGRCNAMRDFTTS